MMGYPTADNLKDFLKGQNLGIDPDVAPYSFWDYSGAVSAASAEFEKAVNWKPFLSSGSPASRLFNAPQPNFRDPARRELSAGLTRLDSVIVSGVSVVSPYVQTKPDNALSQGVPITALAFWKRPFPPLPLCVTVTGVWGYCDTLPADVFQAVLRRAAQMFCSEALLAVSGVVASWQEGDTKEQTGDASMKLAIREYEKQFDSAVRKYGRR